MATRQACKATLLQASFQVARAGQIRHSCIQRITEIEGSKVLPLGSCRASLILLISSPAACAMPDPTLCVAEDSPSITSWTHNTMSHCHIRPGLGAYDIVHVHSSIPLSGERSINQHNMKGSRDKSIARCSGTICKRVIRCTHRQRQQ